MGTIQYVRMYINTNKSESKLNKIIQKCIKTVVQKQHFLSTGTVPGTVRYWYRQECFVMIRFFQKKIKLKKQICTVPYQCHV